MAKIDPSKANNLSGILPTDTISDLLEAFNHYDKEQTGEIMCSQFINILQNFGFHKLTLKERNDELRKSDNHYPSHTHVNFDFCKYVVAYRFMKGGREEDAVEAFKLFDKKDRGHIGHDEIRFLFDKLEFPITDADVSEFMHECDPNNGGYVKLDHFKNLYLS